jgi:hypothetical protein
MLGASRNGHGHRARSPFGTVPGRHMNPPAYTRTGDPSETVMPWASSHADERVCLGSVSQALMPVIWCVKDAPTYFRE